MDVLAIVIPYLIVDHAAKLEHRRKISTIDFFVRMLLSIVCAVIIFQALYKIMPMQEEKTVLGNQEVITINKRWPVKREILNPKRYQVVRVVRSWTWMFDTLTMYEFYDKATENASPVFVVTN